jgi:rhamnose utilization protein RhaD (predicted bifunctional aldolase and dehydrogenase)
MLADFKSAAQQAARAFMDDYAVYFARHGRANGAPMYDPLPLALCWYRPRLFGLGTSANDARIAADRSPEAAVEGITGAEAIGALTRFPKPTLSTSSTGP